MSLRLTRELDRLKQRLLALSAQVEENLFRAVRAIQDRDPAMARAVIEADAGVDRAEVDVEEECLKIIALHQPVASDLRFIVAMLKINNDLERIGDLAVNVAERAEELATQPAPDLPFNLAAMAAKAQAMVRNSLDAVVERDAELARSVCAADDEVDALHRETFALVREGILRHPEHIGALLLLLSVSRHLERVADHATNIAEDAQYLARGEIVRHRGAANGRTAG